MLRGIPTNFISHIDSTYSLPMAFVQRANVSADIRGIFVESGQIDNFSIKLFKFEYLS